MAGYGVGSDAHIKVQTEALIERVRILGRGSCGPCQKPLSEAAGSNAENSSGAEGISG